jgi:plastocyanin
MKRIAVMLSALALLTTTSCDNIPFLGGGGEERTVLVDYSHDEFASFYLFNFPKEVSATPGMKLVFRQTWTGEPHTVTGGTLVNEAIGSPLLKFITAFEALAGQGVPLPNPDGPPTDTTVGDTIEAVEDSDESDIRTDFLDAYEELVDSGDIPDREEADEVPFAEFVEDIDPKVEEAFSSLPFAFLEAEGPPTLAQNVSQPCYLASGSPPKDPEKTCRDKDKPEFDGTQSFYNSGIIPYEGANGNTFEVPLSDDIAPGDYTFYCAVHGAGQSTKVKVLQEGAEIPSQEEVSRAARNEIDEISGPLEEIYEKAVEDGELEVMGEEGEPTTVEGPFAGLYTPEQDHASINEFVPKNRTVRRNEPFTFKFFGADHTISFGVPRYFPIVQFLEDGEVRLNPQLGGAAGGAKEAPEQEGMGVFEVDGGTYDGTGFWSSGLIGAEPYLEYTMRISRPGTYDFACLIHPPMVGKIEVT